MFVCVGCLAVAVTHTVQAEDSTAVSFDQLDPHAASAWARLVLTSVDTEFPNKMSLVYVDASQVKTPRQNFPAFYGCFDWHSSVHGHWVLARLLRTVPDLPEAEPIRATLDRHLSKANLEQEAAFFARDEHKSFERMYGWAWFLRLTMELDGWDDADGRRWRENLRPLEQLLRKRIAAYLPLLSYPIRVGQHTDTAFALGQLFDYAHAVDDPELAALVAKSARTFYRDDKNYPVAYEPSGHDFFSSCWNEADLMRRLLPADEFARWLDAFVPNAASQLTDGTIQPVQVTDVTDGKLVHLAGLNLSRAWCLRAVAEALPEGHPLKQPLRESALRHLQAGVAYVNSGHYEGDHWLATFALYAITESGRRAP
ncbi:DUF2891 domain-containing protein [Roseimaritima ulvae]|uniref:DUF2891 domain-containing protein n=1 Tax=Roseimaritima ulvae TaxID=980254 RepID=UPI0036F44996